MTNRAIKTHNVGAFPVFRGSTPQGSRRRVPPYDRKGARYIPENLWGEAAFGWLLLVVSEFIIEYAPLILFPTATGPRRLPDRRWEEDKIDIWGWGSRKPAHAKNGLSVPRAPFGKDVAEYLISLKSAYPNVQTKCDNVDINADVRQIRMRPDACPLFPTEFDGVGLNIPFDVIVAYLGLAFGRDGAPGVFASVAEIMGMRCIF